MNNVFSDSLEIFESGCAELRKLSTSCFGSWSGLETIRRESLGRCSADVSLVHLWNDSWNFAALVTAWASASEPDIQQKIRSCTWTTLLMVFDETYSLRRWNKGVFERCSISIWVQLWQMSLLDSCITDEVVTQTWSTSKVHSEEGGLCWVALHSNTD